jgi:hypothetical protein
MIIKIFSDFCDSSNCKKAFENCCNARFLEFYGINKNVYITDEDEYTHAIILNKAMPILNIPKENVIGLACEPYDFLGIDLEFVKYAQKYIGKYFIGDKRNLPSPFIEHFGYLWFSRPPKTINTKNKFMSIVLSNKKYSKGHQYRHELLKEIIRFNLPIDIYGRGSIAYKHLSKNVKGTFDNAEPYEDYLYTISIENFRCNHYFSEKIINPIMYNCSPIYIGCRNIHKYFDNIILLSGNLNADIQILKRILKEPFKYYQTTNNEKNEKTVNLLKNVERLFTPLDV